MAILRQELIRIIRKQFALNWNGIHGAPHWARVRENGLRLAETTGADTEVVELFAFFHDSRRLNNDCDYEHGKRAAMFAQALAGSGFELESSDLEDLLTACRGHSDGLTEGNITVLTCWDADRLDLGRVGIKPLPNRLCTAAARDPAMLEWAYRRSINHAGGFFGREDTMANPSDDAELWWLNAPFGCGLVRTVGGMILGGAPIFKKLSGWMIQKLPPSYKYEFIGIEHFESGEKTRSWS